MPKGKKLSIEPPFGLKGSRHKGSLCFLGNDFAFTAHIVSGSDIKDSLEVLRSYGDKKSDLETGTKVFERYCYQNRTIYLTEIGGCLIQLTIDFGTSDKELEAELVRVLPSLTLG